MEPLMISGAAGFIGSQLMDVIKPYLTRYLLEESREPALIFLSGLISTLLGTGLAWLAILYGQLDSNDMFMVLVGSWPAAWGTYQVNGRLETKKKANKAIIEGQSSADST